MTGQELKQIRTDLNFSLSEMARALGYAGRNAKNQVRKMESGKKPITEDRAVMIRDLARQ